MFILRERHFHLSVGNQFYNIPYVCDIVLLKNVIIFIINFNAIQNFVLYIQYVITTIKKNVIPTTCFLR